MEKNEESAGEDLIEDFLEEKAIEFKKQPKILILDNGIRTYRKADFFLQQYKVYIEFLGEWNKPEGQKRYKQKMAIYHKNKIPCVYIWPDNLGTLDWMLKRRMREVLLKYNKTFYLLKFEFQDFMEKDGIGFIVITILLFYTKDITIKWILTIILLLGMYNIIKEKLKRLNKLKKSKWVSGNKYNT